MKINFLVNKVHGGWEPTDKRLGGTEESVVRWARELSIRGHQVAVYHNKHSMTVITDHGVDYIPREHYRGGGDICINVKSYLIAPKEPTLYLTNEMNATELDLSQYLGVIWPSQWAVDNIPVNNKTFVLPHGYDSEEIKPGEKIHKQCLYASSPDRGLSTLLRAWPSVMRAHPDATLIVTYGAEEYDLPSVKFLDATEVEMNELYRNSDIWCHPANGGELFCITGIKAQAAGCVPVIIPTMALAETVKYGYTSEDAEGYAQALINALNEDGQREAIREEMVKHHYDNWQDSTDKLLNIVESVLDGHTSREPTS